MLPSACSFIVDGSLKSQNLLNNTVQQDAKI
jgi:hypothetical protein